MVGVWQQGPEWFDEWRDLDVNTMFAIKECPPADHGDGIAYWKDWSDKAKAAGVWMVRDPMPAPGHDCHNEYDEKYNPAGDFVYENLLGYLQPDEPDGHYINGTLSRTEMEALLKRQYANWRRPYTDAGRQPPPIYMTMIGDHLDNTEYDLQTFYRNVADAADRFGEDWYPINQAPQLRTDAYGVQWTRGQAMIDMTFEPRSTVPIESPGTQFNNLEKIYGLKANYAVIETAKYNTNQADPAPTAPESNGEIWDAVIHGANAVVYFVKPNGNFSHLSTEMRTMLDVQNARLKELGPVLTSAVRPAEADPPVIRVHSASFKPGRPASLQATRRTYGGADYYIVQNFSHQPLTAARFQLIGEERATRANVNTGQGTWTTVNLGLGAVVTDDFEAFETRIYKVAASQPTRPVAAGAATVSTNGTFSIVRVWGSGQVGADVELEMLEARSGEQAVWSVEPSAPVRVGPFGTWIMNDVDLHGPRYQASVVAQSPAGHFSRTSMQGNTSLPGNHLVTNDFIAPRNVTGMRPVISGVGTNGPAAGGTIHPARTPANTLRFWGFANPYAEVTVTRSGGTSPVGTTLADEYGRWMIDHSTNTLASGSTYTFTATDNSGQSSVPFGVTVGAASAGPTILHAQAGTALLANGSTTKERSSTWTVKGRARPGSTVQLFAQAQGAAAPGTSIGTATADSNGVWQIQYTVPSARTGAYVDLVATETAGTAQYTAAVTRIYLDTANPTILSTTAGFDPATGRVDTVTLRYSEPVRGVDLADFFLSDGASNRSLAAAGVKLESADNMHWTFSGLSALVSRTGSYTLTQNYPLKVSDEAGTLLTMAPFRFFVYLGDPEGVVTNDTVRLADSGGMIGVYVNGESTPAYGLDIYATDQVLVTGLAGHDHLIDELPESVRPARGVSFFGGSGTDSVSVHTGAAGDTVSADLGFVLVNTGTRSYAVDYDAVTTEQISLRSGGGADNVTALNSMLAVSVNAGDGNDTVRGSAKADLIEGGAGDDTLYGEGEADTIYGELATAANIIHGSDVIRGGAGADFLYGDSYGGYGGGYDDYANDTLYGEDGNDVLYGDNANGGSGATATGPDAAYGYLAEGGGDFLDGGGGNDALHGEDGDDTYVFGTGSSLGTDTVMEYAYGGTDTLDFSNFSVGLILDLRNELEQQVGSPLRLRFPVSGGIDNVRGSASGDTITGNHRANTFWGNAGADTLSGGDGDDALHGGLGGDVLNGGNGWDLIDHEDGAGDEFYN